MTKRFYENGGVVGGMDENGNQLAPTSGGGGGGGGSGPPQTFEGTLAAGTTTINFTNETLNITIRNTHDDQSLDWSVDAGVTWLTIHPGGEITEPFQVDSLQLRNTAAVNTTYEVAASLSA